MMLLLLLPGRARAADPAAERLAPPDPPTNLQVTPQNDTEVFLTWEHTGVGLNVFTIYRSRDENGPFQDITNVFSNRRNFTDVDLEAETRYCYRVDAVNADGAGASSVVCATTLAPRPDAPTSLSVEQIEQSPFVEINWSHSGSTRDVQFRVYRRESATGLVDTVSVTAAPPVTDRVPEANATFVYFVTAFNPSGESAPSNAIPIRIEIAPPALPTDITATPESPTEVLLAWELPVLSYATLIIERGPAESGPFEEIARVEQVAFNVLDPTVQQNTTYCYRVQAVNQLGSSDFSAPVCLTMPFAEPDAPEISGVTNVDGLSLEITWNAPELADHFYRVERRRSGEDDFDVVADSLVDPSYLDAELEELAEYCYRIQTFNPEFTSDFSDVVCGSTQLARPEEVLNLTAVPNPDDPIRSIVATWDPGSDLPGLTYRTSYRMEGEDDNAWIDVESNEELQQAVITGLEDATVYEVRIRSVRRSGDLEVETEGVIDSTRTYLSFWPGDTNGDGRVNADDVAFMTQPSIFGESTSFDTDASDVAWREYAVEVGTQEPSVLRSDTDRSGQIDVFDFLAIAANAGRTTVPGEESNPTFAAPLVSDAHRTIVQRIYDGFTPDPDHPAQRELKEDLATLLTASPAGELPDEVTLHPNFPNPFNPTTTIRFSLPESQPVRLSVVNALGQEVAVLVSGTLDAGHHSSTLHAESLPSGLYFSVLKAGSIVEIRKMTLLK